VALPSLWRSYARAFTVRRPPLAAPGVRADATLEAPHVVAPAAALAAYRRTCGLPADARALPLAYPHVLASPLHLALVTGPAFPARFLGLVHLRDTIRSERRLPDAAPLDLRCRIEGPRETERGQEFDLVTEARLDGAVAWSETSVLLARRPGLGSKPRAAPPSGAPRAPGEPIARWELPADLGRRYARASGDWNPIHLTAATARLFGFGRAIAHGMWSLARCAAALDPGGERVALEAAFKLPVLLPATVILRASREADATSFALTDAEGARPHLTGTLRSI
jgi:acyl dehydratase